MTVFSRKDATVGSSRPGQKKDCWINWLILPSLHILPVNGFPPRPLHPYTPLRDVALSTASRRARMKVTALEEAFPKARRQEQPLSDDEGPGMDIKTLQFERGYQ